MTARVSSPVGRLPSGWGYDACPAGGSRWFAVVYSPRAAAVGTAGMHESMLEALVAAHRAALIVSLKAWDAARYAAWARADPALFEAPRK